MSGRVPINPRRFGHYAGNRHSTWFNYVQIIMPMGAAIVGIACTGMGLYTMANPKPEVYVSPMKTITFDEHLARKAEKEREAMLQQHHQQHKESA
ncbi:hypothetical protein PROFUN_06560 [Planoprotostelium fungivorum]|uniref:Uncharacterized protein n=1 Tax=Planoprotostelium fungivorum TaxID=1890364 RepID=A0A2P6MRU7_9EUKA|nr:hypothetical protein PROFUN_06560 [Planoprotostelium fungivorum]